VTPTLYFRQACVCDVQSRFCSCFTCHLDRDETYCATSSTLPSYTVVVTRRCEALGTMKLSPKVNVETVR
jgi:hypothetical protein